MRKLTRVQEERRRELIKGLVANTLTDKEHAEFLRLQDRFFKWLSSKFPCEQGFNVDFNIDCPETFVRGEFS